MYNSGAVWEQKEGSKRREHTKKTVKRERINWGGEEFWNQIKNNSKAYQRDDERQRQAVKEALIQKSVENLETVEVDSILRFLLHREIREEIQELGYAISRNEKGKLVLS